MSVLIRIKSQCQPLLSLLILYALRRLRTTIEMSRRIIGGHFYFGTEEKKAVDSCAVH